MRIASKKAGAAKRRQPAGRLAASATAVAKDFAECPEGNDHPPGLGMRSSNARIEHERPWTRHKRLQGEIDDERAKRKRNEDRSTRATRAPWDDERASQHEPRERVVAECSGAHHERVEHRRMQFLKRPQNIQLHPTPPFNILGTGSKVLKITLWGQVGTRHFGDGYVCVVFDTLGTGSSPPHPA